MQKNLDSKQNTSRYFVEHRQVAWAILVGVVLWGVWGYLKMPQRKDPEVPVRLTLAVVQWPGMPAEQIEQLVTKKVEERIAQNPNIKEIRSTTKQGVAYVFAEFNEGMKATGREMDDLQQKLDSLQLPSGVMPVALVKEFGDTATLMLTVASPRVDAVDLDVRTRDIIAAMTSGRTAVLWPHARDLDRGSLARITESLSRWLTEGGVVREPRAVSGPGFTGFEAVTTLQPEQLRAEVARLTRERLQLPEFHPDVWEPVVVAAPGQVRAALEGVAGPKYTYRELDRYSERIEKSVKALTPVARVTRSGLLPERVELLYSQERLASYGLPLDRLRQLLSARSVAANPANLDAQGRSLAVVPMADLRSEKELGATLLPGPNGSSAYLRDVVAITRGYQSPAQFLNFFTYADGDGHWHRARSITLDIQMRSGEQIARFNTAVTAELAKLTRELPADLVIDRTSDQPEQVKESVDLFMDSLWEAVGLVVLVSLIGFWEWRSSLLMALAIPVTLAMTFGMASLLGVDLQQVSIASLIIALGLLIDDPVVAGDAIKRELGAGRPRLFAAWQGPTKLARAILFATITNIVAYLPYLLLTGDNRQFLLTLPIVMTCALVASRIVSMTFIPMLGYYLLRDKQEPTLEERRKSGFGALYYRFGDWAITHRWAVLGAFSVLLMCVGWMASGLKQQFFPFERQHLSFADVWLPENASVSATAETVTRAEQVLRKVAEEYGREHAAKSTVLKSVTSWVGGGSPRYWLSSNPETQQPNYAHILMQVHDKHDTEPLIERWQKAMDREIPGATVDVRRLETSAPIGIPIQIRVSGNDLPTLRAESAKLAAILRSTPGATRVRDDWREDVLTAELDIDDARVTLAGLTHRDVANAASSGLDGSVVGSIREGDREIPITMRLEMDERARPGDLRNLYVYSSDSTSRVKLTQVASIRYGMQPARISRYQQFRSVTVASFAQHGVLPSEVLQAAMPKVQAFGAQLPPGFELEIAGEFKEQNRGFGELAVVMLVSVLAIYFALVLQFRSAIKPLVVFTAIPFGIVGGLLGLEITGTPFGFMAFLGVVSLVGVIVSHIIVLFDFIEDRHQEGESLREALLDAGILRLRPVLITVAATVIALFPLALRGGPLWEPLCYVQIGGLTLSTMVTLVLVPVVYAIFVNDLKWIRWDKRAPAPKANPVTGAPAGIPQVAEG